MSTDSPQGPLVSVADLAALLGEVSVLDVRYRLGGPPGPPEFAAGHVPGAAYVDLEGDLAAPPGAGGRHPLPAPADFEAAMRGAGVSRDRPVVVYDDWAGRAAARAWWLLRLHGHPDVRVLDGGWSAWQAAGLTVEAGAPAVEPGDFTAAADPGMRVVEAGDVPGVAVLIDARAPERYRGEVEPVDPVAGHIPGAVNLPMSHLLHEDGTFRPADEIARIAAEAGVDGTRPVTTSCGSGVTAAQMTLALTTAGIDSTPYVGSWSGWITDPTRPVATGA